MQLRFPSIRSQHASRLRAKENGNGKGKYKKGIIEKSFYARGGIDSMEERKKDKREERKKQKEKKRNEKRKQRNKKKQKQK